MKYNFAEKALGPNFCHNVVKEVMVSINSGSSATIVGIRNVGITPFFRYLVMKQSANFVYVDVHDLSMPKKEELFLSVYRELGGHDPMVNTNNAIKACKEIIYKLLKTQDQIVILINQIDYLQNEFNNGLFINLRAIEDIGKNKIVFLISAIKPLYEYKEIEQYDRSLGFASKIIYFPPHHKSDLNEKASTYPLNLRKNKKDFEKVMALSGGHATLFHMLLKTEYFDNPLKGKVFQDHMQLIYDSYSPSQKMHLRKIAAGRPIKEVDPFLLKIGLIKEIEGKYQLFTPLLRDYILQYIQTKLSRKERLLLSLLKKRLNKLVTKEEMIATVWNNPPEGISDWALNSLIYRLRKSKTVRSSGFVIENDKGEGYRMIKES